MGVSNFMRLVQRHGDACIDRARVKDFYKKCVAIDANIYVYKSMAARPLFEGRHVVRMLRLAAWFKRRDIEPIFVFDGQRPLTAKSDELQIRRERKRRTIDRYDDVKQGVSVLKNVQERWIHLERLLKCLFLGTKPNNIGSDTIEMTNMLVRLLEDAECTYLPKSLVQTLVSGLELDNTHDNFNLGDTNPNTFHLSVKRVLECVTLPKQDLSWIDIDVSLWTISQVEWTIEQLCKNVFAFHFFVGASPTIIALRLSKMHITLPMVQSINTMCDLVINDPEYRSANPALLVVLFSVEYDGANKDGQHIDQVHTHTRSSMKCALQKTIVRCVAPSTTGVFDAMDTRLRLASALQNQKHHQNGVRSTTTSMCTNNTDMDMCTSTSKSASGTRAPHVLHYAVDSLTASTARDITNNNKIVLLDNNNNELSSDDHAIPTDHHDGSFLRMSMNSRHQRAIVHNGNKDETDFRFPIKQDSGTDGDGSMSMFFLEEEQQQETPTKTTPQKPHTTTSSDIHAYSCLDIQTNTTFQQQQQHQQKQTMLKRIVHHERRLARVVAKTKSTFTTSVASTVNKNKNDFLPPQSEDTNDSFFRQIKKKQGPIDTSSLHKIRCHVCKYGALRVDDEIIQMLLNTSETSTTSETSQMRLPVLGTNTQCTRKKSVTSLEDVARHGRHNVDGALDVLKKSALSLETQTVRVHYDQVDEVKRALWLAGELVVEAPHEAEAACVRLCLANRADAVVSDDTDAIPFGAPVILRLCEFEDNVGGDDEFAQRLYVSRLLQSLQLNAAQIVDVCLLAGCDFVPGVRGIGPIRATSLITNHKTLENALSHVSPIAAQPMWTAYAAVKRARSLFLNNQLGPFDDVVLQVKEQEAKKHKVEEQEHKQQQLKSFLGERGWLKHAEPYLPSCIRNMADMTTTSGDDEEM